MNIVLFHIRLFLPVAILLIVTTKSGAQLCQGSLGDPIVNITFGSGANPGAPLKMATTSYQFVSTDCPGDGFYTVRSNTTNCFGSTWHSVTRDHTGDANGYFMLVNASYQPSAFYLDTVKGLCGGTTYEFAAWVMNVLKPTACSPFPMQPNLTFTIEHTDGTVLQTYHTNTIGSVATPIWQQFGFFFTTPMNVSNVVLRIFNNAPGGCGNDLALDDITFRPCGPQIDAAIAGSNSSTVTICEGTVRTFSFTGNVSAGFNNPSYQWQQSGDSLNWSDLPNANSTTLTRDFTSSTTPGNYYYRLSAAEAGNMSSPQCRIASRALCIRLAANPVTNAGSNSPVCANRELVLQASGATQYEWNGINAFSAQGASVSLPAAQPGHSGKYYVLATNDDGCTHLDSVMAVVNPVPVVQTTFTDQTICEGASVQLQSSGAGSYEWTPSTGLSSTAVADPLASPVATVQYSVVGFNQFSCTDTAQIMINVISAPKADAGADRWVIEGTTAQLNGIALGDNISYSWAPPVFMDNPQDLQPLITPPVDTSYVLTVSSNDGCGVATDTIRIFVFKDVFIPNAFSPNNDGLNDTWNIPALAAYPEFELKIFNRYGNVVFQSRQSPKPWDGKYKGQPQPTGIYVYMIDLKDGSEVLKGTLMLVR